VLFIFIIYNHAPLIKCKSLNYITVHYWNVDIRVIIGKSFMHKVKYGKA